MYMLLAGDGGTRLGYGASFFPALLLLICTSLSGLSDWRPPCIDSNVSVMAELSAKMRICCSAFPSRSRLNANVVDLRVKLALVILEEIGLCDIVIVPGIGNGAHLPALAVLVALAWIATLRTLRWRRSDRGRLLPIDRPLKYMWSVSIHLV